MQFVSLKPEQRQSFDEDGFLVVPGALDPTTVADLVAAGDRLACAFLAKPTLRNKPEYNQLDLRPGLLRERAMRTLVAHGKTVSILVQTLGPNIHLHSTALIYKRPEDPLAPPFRRGWHRDIRIPKDLGHVNLPRVGIKICYCLTDFHDNRCGMTLLARKSHLRTQPLAIPDGQIDPLDSEVCDLKVSAGDAILFENRLFHTAAPNLSDRTSKVLMYGYAYRWMKPEIYLERLDPACFGHTDAVTWQLLGGYRDVDTPPWALQRWAETHHIAKTPVPWVVGV